MKKQILLFTTAAFVGFIFFSSYSNGPGANGYLRTGAKGSLNNCSDGGCHGSKTGVTVTITLDSNGNSLTHYKDGVTYRVKIHASGTTNPKYGFQFSPVFNTTPQTSAGTLFSTGNMSTTTVSGIRVVEHHLPFSTSTPGTYDTAFDWKAPTTAGGGPIIMYCTINAVNGDGDKTGSDASGNTSITLSEVSNLGVENVLSNMAITTYPNPVADQLHIDMQHAEAGTYTFNVFDVTGRMVSSETATISGSSYHTSISTGNWAKGAYFVLIVKDDAQRTMQVIK